ncbi:hypothetical protein [Aquicella lusitana]|uniref:Uncharacterized protein n=1 Tax=Aquicella lusitana TaxID=254246 RepID=A0A370H102_9COXI|nr:hypothetical protein [Aquicella lusitana]RDI48654.1 hypothetical protein C8D86_10282 [Aquicella lusitana]VVC73969.1 hypothetical protein AQULUS_17310 [Aquicella lusitana]
MKDTVFKIDFELIAGFIFRLFFVAGGKWYLPMDRALRMTALL